MKIAILTSGGDSAGMNAVVRAVVKAGILKYALSSHILVFFPPSQANASPLTEAVKHGW